MKRKLVCLPSPRALELRFSPLRNKTERGVEIIKSDRPGEGTGRHGGVCVLAFFAVRSPLLRRCPQACSLSPRCRVSVLRARVRCHSSPGCINTEPDSLPPPKKSLRSSRSEKPPGTHGMELGAVFLCKHHCPAAQQDSSLQG